MGEVYVKVQQSTASDYYALNMVGSTTTANVISKPREGIFVYHIHVAIGEWEYCMEVVANTGTVRNFEQRHKP